MASCGYPLDCLTKTNIVGHHAQAHGTLRGTVRPNPRARGPCVREERDSDDHRPTEHRAQPTGSRHQTQRTSRRDTSASRRSAPACLRPDWRLSGQSYLSQVKVTPISRKMAVFLIYILYLVCIIQRIVPSRQRHLNGIRPATTRNRDSAPGNGNGDHRDDRA